MQRLRAMHLLPRALSTPLVHPGFLKIAHRVPDTTITAGIPGGDSVGSVAPTWGNGAVLEDLFPTSFALSTGRMVDQAPSEFTRI